MAKGLFSQCLCLLTDGRTAIEDVRAALEGRGFEGIKLARPQKDWRLGGPTLVLPYRPEVNGYAAVDLVEQPWPDGLGDDPETAAAWKRGHFGPFAFGGGLARAGEHATAWEPGRSIAAVHRGFIRLRTSYVFGTKGDAPLKPQDYDPLAELRFLSRAVLAVFEVPGVVCYFNPNGEVLRDHTGFAETWEASPGPDEVPLPLWTNVRYFSLGPKLAVMDTVGNGQLDVRDVEAVFPKGRHDPGDMDHYLRNVTRYLLGPGRKIQTGEDASGPGDTQPSWTTELAREGANAPPRRVLRLYPKASREAVREALAARPPA